MTTPDGRFRQDAAPSYPDDETAAYLADRSANAPQLPIIPLDQRQRVPAPDPNDPATHRITEVPRMRVGRVSQHPDGTVHILDSPGMIDPECAQWHRPDFVVGEGNVQTFPTVDPERTMRALTGPSEPAIDWGAPGGSFLPVPHQRTEKHRQALIDPGHADAVEPRLGEGPGEEPLNPVGPRTAQWYEVWQELESVGERLRHLHDLLDKLADTDTTPEG